MTDGAAPHDAVGPSRSGIVIVVVAVLVAIVVLAQGYGDAPDEFATSSSKSQSTSTLVSTTTLPAGRPVADVKVKVANATNTPGLAAKVRDILQGRGYTQTTIGDSPNKQLATDVFFLPGWEAEARSVALALGLGPNVVRPMPEPPPISPGDAAILVLAGVDLA
ncbi:MAG: LytR family transcriptional regulator [Acidimicrobiia bacterium]|nr:LytR family transcriptional regulator [Acidimicrobiia bacterium]